MNINANTCLMNEKMKKRIPFQEFGDTLIKDAQPVGFNVLVRAEFSIKAMVLRDDKSLEKAAQAGEIPTKFFVVGRGKSVDNVNLGQRIIPATHITSKVHIPSNKCTAKHISKLFAPGELPQEEYKQLLLDPERNIVVAVDYFLEDCNSAVGALMDEWVDLEKPTPQRDDI